MSAGGEDELHFSPIKIAHFTNDGATSREQKVREACQLAMNFSMKHVNGSFLERSCINCAQTELDLTEDD